MTAPKVFEYKDYKEFIRASLAENAAIRGYQQKLAETARCQKSYFSQMLRTDKTHLSQEQLMRLALYWHLSAVETDYLLELLNLAKTSFAPLRRRILARLRDLKASAENLAHRYADVIEALPGANATTYYSSWTWSAIHILTGIPNFQTVDALATRLSLPPDLVNQTLDALQSFGLVYREGARWQIKPGDVHLPRESPLTASNHLNWRQRAALDAQRPSGDGLHYTAVQSHSIDDFERIKEIVLRTIDQSREVMRPSADEDATCLCLDFFRL